jgi:acyl-phosphate glycerol 3-phosphate acyltransferase
MGIPLEFILVFGGYLGGSVLAADLAFRLLKHKRPYEFGEKPSTRAVLRQIGFIPAALVLLYDVGKGFLPVWLAFHWKVDLNWLPAIAAAPVVAHNWPFLRWKYGGWGMAATGGALLALAWFETIIAFVIGFIPGAVFRDKPGLAIGIIAFPLMLVLLFYFQEPLQVILAAALVMLITVIRRATGEIDSPELAFRKKLKKS